MVRKGLACGSTTAPYVREPLRGSILKENEVMGLDLLFNFIFVPRFRKYTLE